MQANLPSKKYTNIWPEEFPSDMFRGQTNISWQLYHPTNAKTMTTKLTLG